MLCKGQTELGGHVRDRMVLAGDSENRKKRAGEKQPMLCGVAHGKEELLR